MALVIIIFLLSGCGSMKNQEGTQKEFFTLESEITIDYSAYLKKMWIVDNNEDECPVSYIITSIIDNMAEGYCYVGDMVFGRYTYQSQNGKTYLPNFYAEIRDGVIQFEIHEQLYGQESWNRSVCLTFCEEDRMQARLTEGDRTCDYVMRPYNISDRDLCDDYTVSEIELDSWGVVELFYANSAPPPGADSPHHSIPRIFLTNRQGDIIYGFCAYYHHGSEVFEVKVEDMNGDGLKDVEVVTWFGREFDDGTRFEWYFFQQEDGRFAQKECIMRNDDS